MKTILLFPAIFVLAMCTSCTKEKDHLTQNFILRSDATRGFSFEKPGIIGLPNKSGAIPDFTVMTMTDHFGTITSTFLSHPKLENRFILVEEFPDFQSAEDFFSDLSDLEAGTFTQFAMNIQPNQVWLVKSNNGTYGKVLIIESKTDDTYTEITFRAGIIK